MKTLKGILTAVLALSMSTGFAAPSVGEQNFQAGSYDGLVDTKRVSYDDLDSEAQKKIDAAISEYCATADLLEYKKSNVKFFEEYLNYRNNRAVDKNMMYMGVILGLYSPIQYYIWDKSARVGWSTAALGLSLGLVSWGSHTYREHRAEKADLLLKAQLQSHCELKQ